MGQHFAYCICVSQGNSKRWGSDISSSLGKGCQPGSMDMSHHTWLRCSSAGRRQMPVQSWIHSSGDQKENAFEDACPELQSCN